MKRAVSISIGSSSRDKAVELELLGESILIERIGTDGDMEKAAQLYQKLDGVVDAFGVGGTDLGVRVAGRYYPLHSVQKMVRYVQHTPLVDGGGLKQTLEAGIAQVLDTQLKSYLDQVGRRAFITSAADRWGMAESFANAGYACIFGDMMFALGLPIKLRSLSAVKLLMALLMPLVGRVPFEWLYPTGEKQHVRTPRWQDSYAWATVIAGDCHYIKRHMPASLAGKVIVTNTTTPDDVTAFRQAGVRYLLTTTPVLQGRSFGTNMMEAALVAAAGKHRALQPAELADLLFRLNLTPQLQELNP